MTLTDFFTFGLLIVVLWQTINLHHQQTLLTAALGNVNSFMQGIVGYVESLVKNQNDVFKNLNSICDAFNSSSQTSVEFMNQTTYTLQNFAVAFIPIIDDIRTEAVRQDNYDRAQECAKLIDNLQQIANQK